MVEADDANPHLAGVTHDIWSRPVRPVTGIMPPENTSCDMTATTSSGMICSLDFAMDDNTKPSIAEATVVMAMSTNSSRLGMPNATAPWVGPPLPTIAIATTIADWTTANTVYTHTFASRYADVDNPTACSRRKIARSPIRSRMVSAVPMKTAPTLR